MRGTKTGSAFSEPWKHFHHPILFLSAVRKIFNFRMMHFGKM
ncbi:Uncharacterized protein dnm_019280 [Desulfonema magnum]|uniref:Uncharacterized protein n=1 Tax=Desulfonema magnum TaxID=45655 RepID=A0A975BIB4_9BACT|nr:Uncharacterized protein dnm_019280 [Desulfonema magnum]